MTTKAPPSYRSSAVPLHKLGKKLGNFLKNLPKPGEILELTPELFEKAGIYRDNMSAVDRGEGEGSAKEVEGH